MKKLHIYDNISSYIYILIISTDFLNLTINKYIISNDITIFKIYTSIFFNIIIINSVLEKRKIGKIMEIIAFSR